MYRLFIVEDDPGIANAVAAQDRRGIYRRISCRISAMLCTNSPSFRRI